MSCRRNHVRPDTVGEKGLVPSPPEEIRLIVDGRLDIFDGK